MSRTATRLFIRALVEEWIIETRGNFAYLGARKRTYTRSQKDFALSLVDIHGVRATAIILQIPRRTVQRWCRQYSKQIKRCPSWVCEWAERRRRRREFWERRGYS